MSTNECKIKKIQAFFISEIDFVTFYLFIYRLSKIYESFYRVTLEKKIILLIEYVGCNINILAINDTYLIPSLPLRVMIIAQFDLNDGIGGIHYKD